MPSPTPPADVVTVLPAGRTVFGMQLPVQSQSTLYAQPWEAAAGPDELASVARACEAAGFFYIGVCDHTVIPERLSRGDGDDLVRHHRHPRVAGGGHRPDPSALPHLRGRAPPPAAVGQGVRHRRHPVGRAGHLRGRCRSRGRGIRPHGSGVRPSRRGHRRGHRGPRRGPRPRVPRPRRTALVGVGARSGAEAGAGRPVRPSGSAARRRPPSGARRASATVGSPSRSDPTPGCWPSSDGCGPSTAAAGRSTSGASANSSTSALPRRAASCRTGRSPVGPSNWPSTCGPSAPPGWARCRCASPPDRPTSSATGSPPSAGRSPRSSTADRGGRRSPKFHHRRHCLE